jgi:hypothetical protein
MSKYLHLEIPTPCHEDWNKMNPEAQGHFCNSCQKTVTDFTSMSDAQLIAFFKNPRPSVCGRFNGEQLERDILMPRKRIPWVKYFFQFTLPAFLFSFKSSSQSVRIKTAIEKFSSAFAKGEVMPVVADTTIEEPTKVSGTIKDSEGKPVPYAFVVIKGTMRGTAADSLGNFSIEQVPLPCTVSVSCVGFAPKEFRIISFKDQLNINLNPQLMGDVVAYVGYAIPRKKFKKTKTKEVCTKGEALNPSLLIYPNPVSSSVPLHLKWQNLESGNYRVEIYNTAGLMMKSQKLILENGLKETSVSINELLAGNYFARLINEKTGKQLSEQFIVQE